MSTDDLKVNNYHDQSEKIEESFMVALLALLSPLIVLLKSTHPLTKDKIEAAVDTWMMVNAAAISELNEEQVLEIKKIVDSIFDNQVVAEDQIKKYTLSNDQLVQNIVADIKTKFDELSTIENNYNLAPPVKEDYIAGIVNYVEDKVNLFAVMSTISTIRALIFESAKDKNFTEYQWRTQRDNRVRPTHAYMDDKWVKFDEPPKETNYYHVGEDWGCRCFASQLR